MSVRVLKGPQRVTGETNSTINQTQPTLQTVSISSSSNTIKNQQQTVNKAPAVKATMKAAVVKTAAKGLSGGLGGGVKRVLSAPKRVSKPSANVPSTSSTVAASQPMEIEVENESTLTTEPPTSSGVDLSTASLDELRSLLSSAHWTQRLKGFVELRARLERCASSSTSSSSITGAMLDVCITHLDDANARISGHAMDCLYNVIETSYTKSTTSILGMISVRLSNLLLPLFCKLADRRPAIREQANTLLNQLREHLDGVQIIAKCCCDCTQMALGWRSNCVRMVVRWRSDGA